LIWSIYSSPPQFGKLSFLKNAQIAGLAPRMVSAGPETIVPAIPRRGFASPLPMCFALYTSPSMILQKRFHFFPSGPKSSPNGPECQLGLSNQCASEAGQFIADQFLAPIVRKTRKRIFLLFKIFLRARSIRFVLWSGDTPLAV